MREFIEEYGAVIVTVIMLVGVIGGFSNIFHSVRIGGM